MMAFDPFEDAPAVALGDWGETATVPTGVRHVVVVPRPRHVIATSISIDGSPAPGRTVRLRATAGRTFLVERRGGTEKIVRNSWGTASEADLRLLCWRVHCGGRFLLDQRPQQDPNGAVRGESATVQLPPVLFGETLVAVAYTWRPTADSHREWWVNGPDGRPRDGRAGTLGSARQLAEIMDVLPPNSPPTRPVPDRIARLYEAFTPFFADPTYRVAGTLQQAHFLAQIKHESISMTALREKISPDVAGRKYAHTNGNRGEADGRMFIGRGLMQLTGFNNYWEFFSALPGSKSPTRDEHESEDAYTRRQREWLYPLAPQVETDADLAARTAFEFWKNRPVYDRAEADDVLGVSIRVNGWDRRTYLPNHYVERVRYTNQIKTTLGLNHAGGR